MRAASLVVCLLALLCSVASAVPVTGKVHDAAGKPVAGATVYVLVLSDRTSENFRAPARHVATGPDGAFALDWPLPAEQIAYFTAVAHKPGLAVDFASGQKLKPLDFVLKPAVAVTSSVLGADGKPLAGARVTLSSCYERVEDSYKHGNIPEALQDVFAVETDANGQYTLSVVAAGVRPTLLIKTAGYGQTQVSFEKQVAPLRLEKAGSLRGKLTCADAAVKLAGWTVSAYGDNMPYTQGLHRYASTTGKTDADGAFAFAELPPADYRIMVHAPEGVGYGTQSGKATVGSGQTAEATLTVEKLLPVKGRIIGADTKQGLPNIRISGDPGVQTAADGAFTLQCLPGQISIYAYDPEQNYRSTNSRTPKQYTLAPPGLDVGDIPLEPALRLTIQVVDEAGKPVPGAKVTHRQSGNDMMPPFMRDGTATDDKGSLTLKGLTPDTLVISAAKDDLASEQAQVDVGKQQGPLKLVLRPGLMCSITATLRDQNGQPVTDASVELYESTEEYGEERPVPPADAQGRIKGDRLTPGSGYMFRIEAPGCWPTDTPKWTAVAGETHDCGVITLTRNTGAVAGKVVDAAGQPAAGMTVVCSLEAPKPVVATTGADGAFRLQGLMEGQVCLFVHTGGLRCTAQMAKTGQNDVVLKAPATGSLTYGAGADARSSAVPPEAVKQATNLLLAALDKTKGGDYWDRWMLLLALAKLDPQLALQTAAACGDKDDCIRAILAMQHLCDAPEDAKVMLQALDPGQVQQSIMYIHRYDIGQVAPELGAKIGEALLEAATRQRGYDSVCGWAMALRWLQRYDPPRAQALIPDLLLRAQTLGIAERDAYARSMAAQIIVAKDQAAALELLKPIADDNDRDRHTAKLAARLAAADPQKALDLLQGLKQDWYRDRELPECLAAFPAAQRDLALAEARKLKSTYAQARALAKLAQLVPHDQAPALLAEAAEALLRGGTRDNYPMADNVAGLLCVGLVARQRGCADFREIMWRGVSVYDPSSGYGYSDRVRGQVQLASRVAAADPALGRHILEIALQRLGDWTRQENYTQRSIISAATAVDPQWGLALARQMPLDPDPKKRDDWAAAMRTVAGRLSQSDAEQATALLHADSMGQSWLAEDDRLD